MSIPEMRATIGCLMLAAGVLFWAYLNADQLIPRAILKRHRARQRARRKAHQADREAARQAVRTRRERREDAIKHGGAPGQLTEAPPAEGAGELSLEQEEGGLTLAQRPSSPRKIDS